jgi:hypothetical protein
MRVATVKTGGLAGMLARLTAAGALLAGASSAAGGAVERLRDATGTPARPARVRRKARGRYLQAFAWEPIARSAEGVVTRWKRLAGATSRVVVAADGREYRVDAAGTVRHRAMSDRVLRRREGISARAFRRRRKAARRALAETV